MWNLLNGLSDACLSGSKISLGRGTNPRQRGQLFFFWKLWNLRNLVRRERKSGFPLDPPLFTIQHKIPIVYGTLKKLGIHLLYWVDWLQAWQMRSCFPCNLISLWTCVTMSRSPEQQKSQYFQWEIQILPAFSENICDASVVNVSTFWSIRKFQTASVLFLLLLFFPQSSEGMGSF